MTATARKIEDITPADLLAVEREASRRKLATFVKEAWHVLEPASPYIHGWHIDCICDHLEAVTRGDINRLLFNIPPGTMKSLLVSVFWPAWEWGPRGLGSYRFVTASHSEVFALRDNMKMRDLIMSDWFQERWPIAMRRDQNDKRKFVNTLTGFRQATAMASLTGTRGHRVIIDDPHNVEGALSDADRTRTLRTFRETVTSRLVDPISSAIVVVMQRLHQRDVSGFILSDDYGYTHVMLPMRFEPARRCASAIHPDPRTTEGELLFPARFPLDIVNRDEKMLGSHATAGQQQQRPNQRGGGILKGDWFPRWRVLPKMKEVWIFADTAQKTKERNDYSVFACYGLGVDGLVYLIDQIRGKWEAPELKRRSIDFWNKHADADYACRRMAVEDKASGTGLIQELQKEAKTIGKIEAVQRSVDKLTRVTDATAQIEAGNVLIPDDAPWVADFIAECEAFTDNDTHPNDDQIDPLCDAVKKFLQKVKPRGFFDL
jgi:predicted phage terminase large subunit-like protein